MQACQVCTRQGARHIGRKLPKPSSRPLLACILCFLQFSHAAGHLTGLTPSPPPKHDLLQRWHRQAKQSHCFSSRLIPQPAVLLDHCNAFKGALEVLKHPSVFYVPEPSDGGFALGHSFPVDFLSFSASRYHLLYGNDHIQSIVLLFQPKQCIFNCFLSHP